MKLLIFSRDYMFNYWKMNCLNEQSIESISENNVQIYMILQNYFCCSFETSYEVCDFLTKIKVQAYPFINLSGGFMENYYSINIRAIDAFRFLNNKVNFDLILVDNIGFGLAAHIFSQIYNVPMIYYRYEDDIKKFKLEELDKWLICQCDYVICENHKELKEHILQIKGD